MLINKKNIDSWNRKLDGIGFKFVVDSITYNISIIELSDLNNPIPRFNMNNFTEIQKPVKFMFSFSVCEKRLNDFKDILKRFEDDKIENNFLLSNSKEHFKVTASENYKVTELKHNIYNQDFIFYEYEFDDYIINILSKISILENAIEFFSMKWAYNEDGTENYLLKYNVGDVVSKTDNPNSDYIIVDLDYLTVGENYSILYKLLEVKEAKGSHINYGNGFLYCDESVLKNNRRNRLNSILN